MSGRDNAPGPSGESSETGRSETSADASSERAPIELAAARATLAPLTEIGWLASQPAPFQIWAARAGRWRDYAKRQTIYNHGDAPDAVYGLGAGAFEILMPAGRAGDLVTIHRAEPGFWIGDAAILARTSRAASLVSATESRVFRIPEAAIRRLLADQPEFGHAFHLLSYVNVSRALKTHADVFALSPRARLAGMLLRLADANGETQATQADLARLLGVTRSSLQRALGDLIGEGAVSTGYGSIEIIDSTALRNAAAQE